MFYQWKPYVSVAERKRQALREMEKLRKSGQPVSPVVIEGKHIAHTFWGKAWCDNLARYSDLANRLPRGRAYLRNGSVIDLQIRPGLVTAVVSGSELYEIAVKVTAVPQAHWGAIRKDCTGAIDSLVELLQGRFSQAVMERLCQPKTGLFPAPRELKLSCSCPDAASLCKHLAAVLYGIGARLDQEPGLLFKLRKVDGQELIAGAATAIPISPAARPGKTKILADEDLGALFGLDMAPMAEPELPAVPVEPATKKPRAKPAAKRRKPGR